MDRHNAPQKFSPDAVTSQASITAELILDSDARITGERQSLHRRHYFRIFWLLGSETHPPDKDATLTDGVLLF